MSANDRASRQVLGRFQLILTPSKRNPNPSTLGRYGAFLLEEPETCVALVRTLKRGLSVPVTAKVAHL